MRFSFVEDLTVRPRYGGADIAIFFLHLLLKI